MCSDKMYGSFQHYANYCRFFLVPGHEKGAAANFSFCDNSLPGYERLAHSNIISIGNARMKNNRNVYTSLSAYNSKYTPSCFAFISQ